MSYSFDSYGNCSKCGGSYFLIPGEEDTVQCDLCGRKVINGVIDDSGCEDDDPLCFGDYDGACLHRCKCNLIKSCMSATEEINNGKRVRLP